MASVKRVLKYSAICVVGLIVLIIAVVGGLLAYYSFQPNIDIRPAAYSWEKGISETEVDRLAREVLEKMTLEEKVNEMTGQGMTRFIISIILKGKPVPVYGGGSEQLGIPPLAFSDGPKGVAVGESTSFPVAMARGATWDVKLERRVAEAIGKEMRANDCNYFGGLCINLLWHPSGGRAQETYSEDPWLLGEMAVALIDGVQAHNVMACAKHFALNNQETARFAIDVQLDERTLREVFLPHFKKAVDNEVASIMSAYSRFRGQYCGHSPYLLTKILREDWGFTGFVTSDWYWGLRDAVKGVKAGMDVEMPVVEHYAEGLTQALDAGVITRDEIDRMVFRILRTKLYYITREDPMEYPKSLIAAPQHTALAREVAEKGMVLLKNSNGLLPLDKSRLQKVAVVGRLADADNTGDRGSSIVNPPYIVTPLEGIRSHLGDSVEVLYADGKDLNEVRRVAAEAEVVIVVAGVAWNEEGEYIGDMSGTTPASLEDKSGFMEVIGGDRYPLGLKEDDLSVIQAASSSNLQCIVSLIGGSAITMEEWKDQVPAILMAWYFGMEGGTALARVLFGDVNPSGRLPFTIPVNESQLPSFDELAETVEYGPYHGYTLADKQGYQPAFPFGFGLSFTTFEYSNLEVLTPEISKDEAVSVSVDVSNTGQVAGAEVVQLYIGFSNSRVERPVKLLRDFSKVELGPGQTQAVEFSVDAKDLAWYNPDSEGWEIEEMQYELFVGPSSAPSTLIKQSFEVSPSGAD
jgi:beta-glucosidase